MSGPPDQLAVSSRDVPCRIPCRLDCGRDFCSSDGDVCRKRWSGDRVVSQSQGRGRKSSTLPVYEGHADCHRRRPDIHSTRLPVNATEGQGRGHNYILSTCTQ